jgi:cytochrome c oxidase subunit II
MAGQCSEARSVRLPFPDSPRSFAARARRVPQALNPSVPALSIVDTRAQYQHVFDVYVPIAIGVFVVVVVAVLFAVLHYRGRPVSAAARWHEHNPLEGAYAMVLVFVAAFLLYVTFSAEHEVDTVSARERPSLTVDVTASKWEWTFTYPDGRVARSGVVGNQPLVVPTHEAVRFVLRSADVIHSFYIPQLRFKRDLIPGAAERITLDFDRPGTFSGQCAEFCGLRHADMVFTVRALPPAAFATWMHGGIGS